jgi:hypothetical protein
VQAVRSEPSAARLRGIRAGSAYDAPGRTSHNPPVVGSSPTRPTSEVFTFQWGLFSRLGLTFRCACCCCRDCARFVFACWLAVCPGWFWGGCFRCLRAGMAGRCPVVRTGAVARAACSPGYGGRVAVVSTVSVLRRRLRVFAGSPAAARRAFSACRASQTLRMRWLRTMSRVVVNSMRGVRPVRRHQPRLMSLAAGSLAVAKPRSAPVRRA